MASLPANDVIEPVVAAEIIILNPAEITIGERLRAIDRVHAEALGRSMMKDSQISPIDVCRLPGKPGWHLAGPGGHRLTGALIVGMDGIEAREVSASLHSRRTREAVENLFRRENDPIDRAAAIAELVMLKREKAGLAVSSGRDAMASPNLKRAATQETAETLETISRVYGWSDELGAELGFTGRTIRNDLMLYRGLRPSLVTRLREARHPVVRNASQLRALARLDSGQQERVVETLVGVVANGRTITSVAQALVLSGEGKQPVDAETKRYATALGTVARMSATERLGLFQSPQFHDLLPAEAKRLLAPMLRDGKSEPQA